MSQKGNGGELRRLMSGEDIRTVCAHLCAWTVAVMQINATMCSSFNEFITNSSQLCIYIYVFLTVGTHFFLNIRSYFI